MQMSIDRPVTGTLTLLMRRSWPASAWCRIHRARPSPCRGCLKPATWTTTEGLPGASGGSGGRRRQGERTRRRRGQRRRPQRGSPIWHDFPDRFAIGTNGAAPCPFPFRNRQGSTPRCHVGSLCGQIMVPRGRKGARDWRWSIAILRATSRSRWSARWCWRRCCWCSTRCCGCSTS